MARPLYLTLGALCLLLGLIGVVLPLLPTTPFVILAAFCFSKSSVRVHRMLVNNRLFGKMIVDWERDGTIPLRAKIISTVMMVVMISYPVLFKALPWWADVSMVFTALVGGLYIWSRPSSPAREPKSENPSKDPV